MNSIAPGLRLRVGALRLSIWVDRADAAVDRRRRALDVADADGVGDDDDAPPAEPASLARTRLAVCADVDDVALEHAADAGYAHADFLSARRVRVALSVDHRLVDGLANAWLGRRPVRWSPFPAAHARLRADRDFEPTRLRAVRVDALRVDGVRCAFDHANGEFNVARLCRDLAAGKVSRALRRGERAPNTLRLSLVAAEGLYGARVVFAVVSVRNLRRQTAAATAIDGRAAWNEHFTFPCPDPSAVVHVGFFDAGRGLSSSARLLAQWIVTAKMLVVAPRNVYAVGPGAETKRETVPPSGERIFGEQRSRPRE